MKQTIEQRRLHHQTKEDRQMKAYKMLWHRISWLRARPNSERQIAANQRDFDNLCRKLNLA